MGIFSKKKEERNISLPEFPRLPPEPRFPAYEPSEFTRKPEFEIPIRKPEFEISERIESAPISSSAERPIFVKIDKYKEAAASIEAIKNQIKETEMILDELEKLKDKEERELANWRESLDQIKQKLLAIDKNLFE